MKTTIYTLIIVVSVLFNKMVAQKPETEKMVLKGFYSGKNMVVKNQICSGKGEVGFSVTMVKINGQISTADINNQMFEIPLEPWNLKIGDSLKVEIYHKKVCSPYERPTIMNPGSILTAENIANKKENHLVIEGQFVWSKLLVINPYNPATKSYCIKEVKVNGKVINSKIDKDVIGIDIGSLGAPVDGSEGVKGGLKEGDKIKIEFKYSKEGEPFILNPEVIVPFK